MLWYLYHPSPLRGPHHCADQVSFSPSLQDLCVHRGHLPRKVVPRVCRIILVWHVLILPPHALAIELFIFSSRAEPLRASGVLLAVTAGPLRAPGTPPAKGCPSGVQNSIGLACSRATPGRLPLEIISIIVCHWRLAQLIPARTVGSVGTYQVWAYGTVQDFIPLTERLPCQLLQARHLRRTPSTRPTA